ncbi:MAG: DNA methyltransferase [Candidatus Thorarchaeota archaeon]
MSDQEAQRITLNDLNGKEWVKATKSWFIVNPSPRRRSQLDHPAKYPEQLVKRFVTFFTREGQWVLDPFAGVGSTMIGCKDIKRNSVGIELNDEFAESGRKEIGKFDRKTRHYLITGDTGQLDQHLKECFGDDIPEFNYLITSPPYWNMLRKSRGGNDTVHKERKERGLKQYYSSLDADLGNIDVYEEYISSVADMIALAKPYLADRAYLTIVAQNMRDIDGTQKPIAWDLARKLSDTFALRQEMIWCQDNKRLGVWGYPTTYVSNVHHHYCLVFQNSAKS